MLVFILLWRLVASARNDCEACVAGWCHARETFIQGFRVTDQLAIDHTNNVLYIQLNSTQNTAFHLDDLKVQLVLTSNTSGMTIDQDTQVLYLASHGGVIYEYRYGSDKAEISSMEIYEPNADRLFYKGKLYYTSKHCKGINFISGNETKYYDDLVNYTITDFVVNNDGDLYFVANDTVYLFSVGGSAVEVAKKNYVLSTDKYGGVYFGDATENVIHTLNEFNEIVVYAVYETGSVDKFVFDNAKNIVFYDSTTDSMGIWRNQTTKCIVEAPRTKYHVKKNVPNVCTREISENLFKGIDATEVVKHCLNSGGLVDFCECLKQFL